MPKITKMNVVVKGLWNPRIFHPGWLKQRFSKLYPNQSNINIEGQLNLMELTALYTINDITIFPKYDSLVLETTNIDNSNKLSELFMEIMNSLPQTPITAFGINFHCELETSKSSLAQNLRKFSETKFGKFKPSRFSTEDQNNYDTNITIEKYDDPILVQINFHYNSENIIKIWSGDKEKLIENHKCELMEIIE